MLVFIRKRLMSAYWNDSCVVTRDYVERLRLNLLLGSLICARNKTSMAALMFQ